MKKSLILNEIKGLVTSGQERLNSGENYQQQKSDANVVGRGAKSHPPHAVELGSFGQVTLALESSMQVRVCGNVPPWLREATKA